MYEKLVDTRKSTINVINEDARKQLWANLYWAEVLSHGGQETEHAKWLASQAGLKFAIA